MSRSPSVTISKSKQVFYHQMVCPLCPFLAQTTISDDCTLKNNMAYFKQPHANSVIFRTCFKSHQI